MKREAGRRAVRAAAGLLAIVTWACGGAAPPQSHTVDMASFGYDPDSLAVAAGDTVTWTNHDIVPHTVTAGDGQWDSGAIAAGSTWTLVVTEGMGAGYSCVYHPGMRGALLIDGGETPAPGKAP